MKTLTQTTDQSLRKTSNHTLKIEKDLAKKEEQLKASIDRVEKSLSLMFTTKTIEIEGSLSQTIYMLSDTNSRMSKNTHDIFERIDRLMETEQIKEFFTYQLDHTLAPIRHEFKKDFLSLQSEFLEM